MKIKPKFKGRKVWTVKPVTRVKDNKKRELKEKAKDKDARDQSTRDCLSDSYAYYPAVFPRSN